MFYPPLTSITTRKQCLAPFGNIRYAEPSVDSQPKKDDNVRASRQAKRTRTVQTALYGTNVPSAAVAIVHSLVPLLKLEYHAP